MKEHAVFYLSAFGVENSERDPLLDYVINNTKHKIFNLTNVSDMPEGLLNIAVYMAIGEYLRLKKASGTLENFNLEAAVKQIQEGDTNISFAIGDGSLTPEQRLDSLISYLLEGRASELYRFRRLSW